MTAAVCKALRVGTVTAAMLFVGACSWPGFGECRYVEIAPGKFVPVKFSLWRSKSLIIRHDGRVVTFNAPSGAERPESLMEYGGKLYVLAPGEYPAGGDGWRWWCFEQKGNGFVEIPAERYPRSIAIINIWRPAEERPQVWPRQWSRRYTPHLNLKASSSWARSLDGKLVQEIDSGGSVRISIEDIMLPERAEGRLVDQKELARELDSEDVDFLFSDIVRLWHMLEVKNSFDRGGVHAGEVQFVRDYIAKYKPVKLTGGDPGPVPKDACDF